MRMKSDDKMKVSVSEFYTSVACNRIPEIADWNEEGIICYGATNAVVIYDTNVKGGNPIKVFCHHKSKVNSVKWLRKPDGTCTELVSCSADKTAAIWTLVDNTWKVTSTLTGHADGVTCVHGLYTEGSDLLVFTGSIDSTVKVWERKDGITNLKQTISLNSGLCLTLHAHLLPSSKTVLFCALDDHKIHVFAGEEFHRVHSLMGHEDWVRGLDVLDVDATTILLASASQDTYIRLWRIQAYEEQSSTGIRVEQRVFLAYGQKWAVKLDAVLAGHEGWVYGVQWHPYAVDADDTKKPVYRLLSSSLDKTLIVWEPDTGAGAWSERVRVGEVGGSGLGFYGSRFGPRGGAILGHGYNGSFHVWKVDEETQQWVPCVVPGGHFGGAEDAAWPAGAKHLLSVGADQTTRLHAPWRRPDGSTEWHELARPQVHGYDMAAVALVSARVFASAAEEKVVRVFAAPANFDVNYANIVGAPLPGRGEGAEGASVPSLGLSNKAVFADDDDNDGYFVPVNLTEPPTEETLMQHTLWPEQQKLYGHGYEVFALAAAADGSLLASACKSTSREHAAILLWETSTWHQIQKLPCHQLTITQLAFSPDSRHLLSVSRDRTWYLHTRVEGNQFQLAANTDKTNGVHTRIIWCCAWASDSSVFGTGSREGKVCVWSKAEPSSTSLGDYALLGTPLELPKDSVTALAFAPDISNVLAVGLDSGRIEFYSFGSQWTLLKELDHSAAHHLTVRKLTFKPKDDDRETLLASAGADHLVRIYSVHISC